MGCEAYLDEIKKKHADFHYHLNHHYIPDNAGYVKLEILESHQNTLLTYYCVEIVSIRWQSFGFEAYLDAIKKKKVFFIITSIVSIFLTMQVILDLNFWNHTRTPDSPITILTSCQFNDNRRDLKFTCMTKRKNTFIFIITSIVSILLTKQVILNSNYCNQTRTLYWPITTLK